MHVNQNKNNSYNDLIGTYVVPCIKPSVNFYHSLNPHTRWGKKANGNKPLGCS